MSAPKIPRAVLELHRFACTDLSRSPGLRTVWIEAGEGEERVAVATDGHRMCVLKFRSSCPACALDPGACMQAIRLGRKEKNLPIVLVGPDLEVSDARLRAIVATGDFPDWRRVVPDTAKADAYDAGALKPGPETAPVVGLDLAYVGDFGAYLRACGEKSNARMYIGSNGEPVLFRAEVAGFDASYVLMPVEP